MSEDPPSTVPVTVVDVTIEAPGWSERLPNARKLCRDAVGAALSVFEAPAGEVSVVLGDDAMVRELNRTYRDRDRPTNVLSFPQDEQDVQDGLRLLGDVIVALETVEREAAAQGKRLADHLAHLIVHGTAHLLGRDHQTPAQAAVMERGEIRALALLGIADPYRSSSETRAADGAAATA